MEGNFEAWELWVSVRTQWRAGGMGIIGLDYTAVFRMAEYMEIDLSPCLLRKIQRLETDTLEKSESRKQ